jgi:hypothetical protein
LCPRCGTHVETVDHVFKECKKVPNVWKFYNLGGDLCPNPKISYTEWLVKSLKELDNKTSIQILAIIYNVRHARNQANFEKVDIPDEIVVSRAFNSTEELVFYLRLIPHF